MPPRHTPAPGSVRAIEAEVAPPPPVMVPLAQPAPRPRWQRALRIVGASLGITLLFAPVILLLMSIYARQLPSQFTSEQPLIGVFREMIQQRDFWAMVAMYLAASVLAPLQEEMLFRGYLYPVFKRYGGPLGATLLVSVLFSAIHGNVGAALGLFLLALAFTFALEWSGSLWVSIGMHCLFNTAQLTALVLVSK